MTDENKDKVTTENAEVAEDTTTADKPCSATKCKVKRILTITGTCVCAAIVAFLAIVAVWLAFEKFVKKSPAPSLFGYSFLIVETGSMNGTINEGDMIIIKKTNDYKVGDIITFLPDGDRIPTTHRIIRIQDGKYFTRGDANNAEDVNPVTDAQILGEVQKTVPHVGLFFRWFTDENGWLYLVAIVVVIFLGVILLRTMPSDKTKE